MSTKFFSKNSAIHFEASQFSNSLLSLAAFKEALTAVSNKLHIKSKPDVKDRKIL